ncbi:MAG TPA: patatin-like phospholipase family protein [Candidatus Dormibacteraeota bacterium]|jgi:predicted patatin/cPLA2 family phospholipase|nr:patatin-like phospholipase family protein [Candidatus Dormibacteraeota bacterium]
MAGDVTPPPTPAPEAPAAEPLPSGKKRSLILAGGGMKVAFQAGVLQVWLDEAGLDFDHADGASGGVFQLAMWCQGMTGTQIADNWRNLDPNIGMEFSWRQDARLFYAESLLSFDNFRERVFPDWGLDWDAIRATQRDATFNVYNFSRHQLEVLTPNQMDAEMLGACVALPMWFPPVRRNGDTYIDSVYATDANLEEAIRRGADELWVVWTVSMGGEWRDGFVANYFQVIEAAANWRLKQVLARIDASNVAIAGGGTGEFGRHVEVRMLQAEVPLNYLVNWSRDRIAEAVNLGVKVAREWCAAHAVAFTPGPTTYPTSVHDAGTSLRFTEEMKGFLVPGDVDYEEAFVQGKKADSAAKFHLTIEVDGVHRFNADPDHLAAATGYVESEALGGRMVVEQGAFNLFVDGADPSQTWMIYRLFFRDLDGRQLTLSGFKDVKDAPGFDPWNATTTLYTRVFDGFVDAAGEKSAPVVASGILRIHMLDFIHQLTTFRVTGPTTGDRMSALTSFGQLFMGKLWDVYARDVLAVSPV